MSDALGLAAEIVKRFEGCELTAYRCPRGRLTIGYGHTGSDVSDGKSISLFEADRLLRADLAEASGNVMRLVTADLTDNERAALISFVFNEGGSNFLTSKMRRKINAGAPKLEVAEEFGRWNKTHVNGTLVVLDGLTDRRAAEKALFLTA